MKFIRHDIKEKIFGTKKRLAEKPFLITESLTATRIRCIKKLQLLKRKNKIDSYWTNDDSVYYISAPQPFLTHGTLKPCPNFCGTPQQKSAENLHIKSL